MEYLHKKKLKCFRLHPVDIDRLQEASIKLGLYQTNIVERALQKYFMKLDKRSKNDTILFPVKSTQK